MAKGYWIAHVNVNDAEGYKRYTQANAAAFAKFGARFLVRGGPSTTAAGALKARHIVIEFKDYATALACLESEEYRRAAILRDQSSAVDLVVVEGHDAPPHG
ncbi:MAG TPA: DUF1330 domain-containing protein [Roseiarcus sp.]